MGEMIRVDRNGAFYSQISLAREDGYWVTLFTTDGKVVSKVPAAFAWTARIKARKLLKDARKGLYWG